jgi:hypothetical protein
VVADWQGEVMEPKPLSAKRRDWMMEFHRANSRYGPMRAMIDDLLAAERYWREAVRDCSPLEFYGASDSMRCYFCQSEYSECFSEAELRDPDKHTGDCQWLLAQEAE